MTVLGHEHHFPLLNRMKYIHGIIRKHCILQNCVLESYCKKRNSSKLFELSDTAMYSAIENFLTPYFETTVNLPFPQNTLEIISLLPIIFQGHTWVH